MTLTGDVFGQPIERTKANLFFERFLRIKERTAGALKNVLKNDKEAKRYYCGREKENTILEDWAYIFDKTSLQHIMSVIDSGRADGLIIYNGVRSASDSPTDDQGTPVDVDGRPTLMLFPVKYVDTKGEISFELLGDDGREHPGTGGGKGALQAVVQGNSIKLPDTLTPPQVHKID